MKGEFFRIVGVLIFFYLPGFLCFCSMGKISKNAFISIIPISFMLTIAATYPAAMVIFLFETDFSYWLLIFLIVLYLPALILYMLKGAGNEENFLCCVGSVNFYKRLLFFLPLLILLVCIVQYRFDIYTNYDAGYFLNIVRKISDLSLSPYDNAYVVDGVVDQAYGFNSYLLSVGLLCKFLGQDPLLVWGTLSVFGFGTFIIAIYLVSERLFKSELIALLVMNVFIVFRFSSYFAFQPVVYADPSMLTRCLCLILLWMYLGSIDRATWQSRVVFAFSATALLSVHPHGLILFSVYAIGLVFLSIAFDSKVDFFRNIKEFVVHFFLLLIVSGPYLYLRLSSRVSDNGPVFSTDFTEISRFPNVTRYLMEVFGGYALKPNLLMYSSPFLGWLGVLVLFVLLFVKDLVPRKHIYLCFGGISIVLFITFNPFLYPLVASIISVDQVGRLGRVNPIHAVSVFGGIIMLIMFGYKKINSKIKKLFFCTFVALFVVVALRDSPSKIYENYKKSIDTRRKQPYYFYNAYDALNDIELEKIKSKLPQGEPVFNASRLFEKSLPPLVNVRVYAPHKLNWASMNMEWDRYLDRKKKIDEFNKLDDSLGRWKIVRESGLSYVAIDESVQLVEPYFSKVGSYGSNPKVAIYRAASSQNLTNKIE